MATKNKNLSQYDKNEISNAFGFRIGIAVSDWNKEITNNLYKGALDTLQKNGVKKMDILTLNVSGSFELPLAAQWLFEYKKVDAVICLGSVIQGETKHFDFVCQTTALGIKDVELKYNKPVIFGVLTDNNLQQAKDRSGGKYGNKGIECAIAAIKMIALQKKITLIN